MKKLFILMFVFVFVFTGCNDDAKSESYVDIGDYANINMCDNPLENTVAYSYFDSWFHRVDENVNHIVQGVGIIGTFVRIDTYYDYYFKYEFKSNGSYKFSKYYDTNFTIVKSSESGTFRTDKIYDQFYTLTLITPNKEKSYRYVTAPNYFYYDDLDCNECFNEINTWY